ncbi:DISARM system phospholipase D-like protein DrmC [Streptomyces sp. NPDC051561]|uniref:DISARM system phospholipase D-like protein DrmC n=1 Tax=Streptomyces sp. NPDC051561 TaxID=3365658 RepID=UPI0037BC32CE
MNNRHLEAAAAKVVADQGPDALRVIAEGIGQGKARSTILTARAVSGFAEAAKELLDARAADAVPDVQAEAYLLGLAAGYAQRQAEQDVSLVWSGPSSPRVPVRATDRALLTDVVAQARSELILMTYSAQPYAPLTEALGKAVARGVSVDVVVETLQGAGSALQGTEPASAFLAVPGVVVWHWPPAKRPEPGAKTHAKLAVADRSILLTTSANLTRSGVSRNIEAGVLVRGGSTPTRTVEHIRELQSAGILQRY